eukprot:GFUD01023521.1.p1 GENE.GFUD01023521.1~~GFUD01023521.1.p1  ORF type:complete len:351 (+),score=130.34 GFUD01023521.1:57-1109(+)
MTKKNKTGSSQRRRRNQKNKIAASLQDSSKIAAFLQLMRNKTSEGKCRVNRTDDVKVKREKVEEKEWSLSEQTDNMGRERNSEQKGEPRYRSPLRVENRKRGDSCGSHCRRGEQNEYKKKGEEEWSRHKREHRERISQSDQRWRERNSRKRRCYGRERSPDKEEGGRRDGSYEREDCRRGEEEESRYKREKISREMISPKREKVRESSSRSVEEVTRSGNFDNRSRVIVKVDTSTASTSSQAFNPSSQQRSVSEEVDRLHRKVAANVMKNLNSFYPGTEEFEPELHKIGSPEEYSKLAKQFSHQLRRQIKESYEAYHHGSLEGIVLTGDNEQFIRTEVESYFEGVSCVRK